MYSASEYYKSKFSVCLAVNESEALTFEIESYITPLTCAGTKSMVHYSISSSFEIPMITLAFMKSKQAYLEELKHFAQVFQFPKIFQAS